MKYLFFVALLGWAATSFAASNNFAFDAYRELARDPGNVFFSPYSLSSALTMTSAGARGATLDEMRSALRLGEEPHAREKKLRETLESKGGRGPVLAIANRLWGRTGQAYDPAFLRLTQDDYGAGLSSVDFAGNPAGARQEINDWAEAETQHRIHDLLPSDAIDARTDLVLTSAIYFNGRWDEPFDGRTTRTQMFHPERGAALKRPFLRGTLRLPCWENAHFQAVRLAYEGRALEMTVLLPKPGTSLAALEKSLSPELLRQIQHQGGACSVRLELPKFRIDYGAELTPALRKLGMKRAFTQQADFSGIRTPIPGAPFYLSRVIQKAFVEVDEKGTEAAAATAVVGALGAAKVAFEPPVPFVADHPFLFLIGHAATDTVLFMGRVARP